MFINPNEILNQINLKNEMIVADFGAGSGEWSLPVAKIVDKGRVYALDILEEPLSILKKRAIDEGIFNIQTKIVNLEKEKGSSLGDDSVDFIIISNILFQIDFKEQIIKEAIRIIKKQGHILIIDWKKHDKFGPTQNQVISETNLEILTKKAGLKINNKIDGGDYHYILSFKKL